jgi:hypothetical protein
MTAGRMNNQTLFLWPGFSGPRAGWGVWTRIWKRHLDSPLCGRKERISRFHAYDCYQSVGEFTGWTRTETDYFRHQLRTVIIESDVAAYGIACSRKDYDELISGDLRGVLGDPEGLCINQCFVRSLGWVQANTFDPKMTFVFDNRPSQVKRYAGAVYDAFQAWVKAPPQLTGYAFLESKDVRPLQAADLVAWELYQYVNAILIEGLTVPAQKEILHLSNNMNFNAQIANRESIVKLRDYWQDHYRDQPDALRQMADHFNFFDPENPDYSHLSTAP